KDFAVHGSDRTIFHFRFNDENIKTWQPLLYDTNGNLLGYIDGWYRNDWMSWDWWYWDLTGSWYTPCTLTEITNPNGGDSNWQITKTGESQSIPEGKYKMSLLVRHADGKGKVVEVSDYCIDNTLPNLTLSNSSNSKWIGTVNGDSVVFSGNIYDTFTEEMKELGINSVSDYRVFGNTTSQKDNVLVVRVGENDYRAEIDEKGDFTVTVPAADATKDAVVYYGDHFLPQGKENRLDTFKDGFDPEALSYTVLKSDQYGYMNAYAYRATNMAAMNVTLSVPSTAPDDSSNDKDDSDNKDDFIGRKDNEEETVWDIAEEKIKKANKGDRVTLDIRDRKTVPEYIMRQVRAKGLELVIRWNGNTITIPAGEAPEVEKGRVNWPLSLLSERYDANYVAPTDDKVNPPTGAVVVPYRAIAVVAAGLILAAAKKKQK
ncbi:MAG: hypothetical protein J6A26_00945, partial [Oscillospiraceae bacterium]|nr:hypothetical protein [Oscillospiraceae bacterium]